MIRMPGAARKTVVVIGGGMVGYRFCEQLSELDTSRAYQLVLFGEEPRLAYDRVHLTSYLEDRNAERLSLAPSDWYAARGVELFSGERVTSILPARRCVVTDRGRRYPYDVLVLATGSRPFVPPIPGLEQPGVFLYRTIEDLDAIAAAAASSRTAAVLGGGLLGLEAAKALLDLGLKTTVVENAPRLMPRQLDARGGRILAQHIERLGVEVRVGAKVVEVMGDASSLTLRMADAPDLAVDLLVVSTGIRPRDELASSAEIAVDARGGVAVNDVLQTSCQDIYAIGECASHRGFVYGLVAPGQRMADVLASRLCGDEQASFDGADLSTRLKLLGVDVASVGDPFADERGGLSVHLENCASGTYQKVILDADGATVRGAILVGDTTAFGPLVSAARSGNPLKVSPEALLCGSSSDSSAKPALAEDDLICTCNGVCLGSITSVVANDPAGCTVDRIKKQTRAGTGCGGCLPQLSNVLRAELSRLGRATKNRLCEHFDYTRQELFDLIRVKGYRDFDQLIAEHGCGLGCEICKPAVASILASTQNELVLKHAKLQDTNDRYLANIQKQGLYSVVPRIPGGEITPRKLAVIASVAEKYGLYTKITGGQRIDLFGATLEQLPLIWEELVAAGFESGHAYGKALRTVKSCVGSTWCRFGVNDSVGFAIRVENRYKGIRAPHKIKSAVSGCVRECAEAQSKDFGFIATEQGWNLYVCGNGGSKPRHAELLASGLDDEMALRLVDRFIMFYIRTADRLTRTAPWLEQMEGGIEHLRDVIVNDSLGIAAELERAMQELVDTYQCEWAAVVKDPALREQFREHRNAPDDTPAMHRERGQLIPLAWPKADVQAERIRLPVYNRSWVPMLAASEIPRDTGVTVKFGRAQIAVFRTADDRIFATQARCPHKGDAVLGRGLVGDQSGVPKVACPLHKRTFSLETGECLNAESAGIVTFPTKVEGGLVYLELAPAVELEASLEDGACGAHCSTSVAAAE